MASGSSGTATVPLVLVVAIEDKSSIADKLSPPSPVVAGVSPVAAAKTQPTREGNEFLPERLAWLARDRVVIPILRRAGLGVRLLSRRGVLDLDVMMGWPATEQSESESSLLLSSFFFFAP